MLSEKLDTIMTELVEIMDRLEELPKSDKDVTDKQKIDIDLARDYIYLGFTKLKEIQEDWYE